MAYASNEKSGKLRVSVYSKQSTNILKHITNSDRTGQMYKLIWAVIGCTGHFAGVLSMKYKSFKSAVS